MAWLSERNENLWRLAASPMLWFAHFLLSYMTAAVWCGKFAGAGGSLWTARVAIAAYTAVALAAILFIGWQGSRRHRLGGKPVPFDADTAEDRTRFLGYATLLLSVLSAVAILYAALAAVFIPECF